jgi:hypothetical protein
MNDVYNPYDNVITTIKNAAELLDLDPNDYGASFTAGRGKGNCRKLRVGRKLPVKTPAAST